ncbi:helix-turn-helix domain-containing protein [Nocardia sp. NPDC003693]
MHPPHTPPAGEPGGTDNLDDEDFPAYSMGRAAEILAVTPAFLRTLDTANLLTPQRSAGGHRRYSRYQLRIAARVRELLDTGNSLDGACRIVILEDQLAEAHTLNTTLQTALDQHQHPTPPP